MNAPTRYITYLGLRNFRAFEFQNIELAPITVFVGPNNSGKSSILSAIRLLSQSLQSVDSEVPLLLGEFGTFRDLVFGNNNTRPVGISLGFKYRGGKQAMFSLTFKYRAQRREIILRDINVYGNDGNILLQTVYSKDTERQGIKHLAALSEPSLTLLSKPGLKLFHFLPRLTFMRMEGERLIRQNKLQAAELKGVLEVERISREAIWLLQSVQYLGPFRDVPLRVYPFSGERPSVLGPTGREAPDILVADYFRRGARKKELSNQVRNWFIQAKIAKDIEIVASSDRHYEIKLSHPLTGEYENLADVGFGISQVLPVVVAGHNLNDESIFLVEQPEIHLHPRSQAELGSFLLALHDKGVQSIIETHSEHLIMRLQRHIAEGKISPEDVAINYVGADENSKKVERMRLDEKGIFRDEWPEGFFAERLQEALNIAKAPLSRSMDDD